MQPGIVTADRLRRVKCPICGSKEKNVQDIHNVFNEPVVKIMVCNQCGYITTFGISAAAIADIIVGGLNNVKSIEYYDNIVHCQHEINHPE